MSEIHYISTRGKAPRLNFADVTLAGLASDGGLYLPETLPHWSPDMLASWAALSYPELAYEILKPFTAGALPEETLRGMLNETYASFRHPAIAPAVQLDRNLFLLELFHGPTLAFKDFALQFLGSLMEYFLKARGEKALVLGATSGDTGSAAIEGFRGRAGMRVAILYPHGRVSDVQRRQMTTVADANVHCLAVEGSFDDCQDAVKTLFKDEAFRTRHRLIAVNSINWARILAQVVYYVYAALALGAPGRKVNFAVPTGNFGDIYAGYLARRMGLPIGKLLIASNRNDVLTRCLHTGCYASDGVHPSLSPSMDIAVSSNFERLLFDLHGRDAATVSALMDHFAAHRTLTLSPGARRDFERDFAAESVNDEETLATIAHWHACANVTVDPHSAVGLAAAGRFLNTQPKSDIPLIVLATAHPAKFPDAVVKATGHHPALPAHLDTLLSKPERFTVTPAVTHEIRAGLERIAQESA